MSPGAAYITRQILSRPLPGQEGIAKLSGNSPVAWKTGTSYGFRDAWALGLMGDYVVGVWVGRPDGSPSPGQYGAVTAVPLMTQIMESLPLSREETNQESDQMSGQISDQLPDTVEQQTICWPSGISDTQLPGSCMVRHKAWILNHQIPPTLTENQTPGTTSQGRTSPGLTSLLQTIWVDARGNRAGPLCGGVKKITLALWPWAAEPWLPGKWRRNRLIPKASAQCPDLAPITDNRLRIISISNDSLLTSPPGQAESPLIPLKTLGSQGQLYWFLNRRPLNEDKGENKEGNNGDKKRITQHFMPMPAPGTYQLAVMDRSGNSDMVNFRVISSRTD